MEKISKTKILFAVPSLSVGGIERQLIKQFEIFDRNKFEINLLTLFSYPGKTDLYDKVPSHVKVYKVDIKNKFDIFGGFFRIKKILKEISPDVVVSSMFSANTIFRILQPKFGYKNIAREHNIYHEKKWWQKKIDKYLSKRSFKIVAVSKTVAEFASKQARIPLEKFIIIHNGVEIDNIENFKNQFSKHDLRQKLNIKDSAKVFLNVGRLKPQKQQGLLIDAFKIISEKNSEAILYIVGRGPEEEFLRKKISENKLEDRVFMTGYSDSVFDYYRAADIFVLSSKYEGFPNVAIEAMAFGLPLISTNLPGVDEFLIDNENGFLIKEDIQSISEKMETFLNLSELDKLNISKKSEETAKNFDIKDTVRKYSEIYVV